MQGEIEIERDSDLRGWWIREYAPVVAYAKAQTLCGDSDIFISDKVIRYILKTKEELNKLSRL